MWLVATIVFGPIICFMTESFSGYPIASSHYGCVPFIDWYRIVSGFVLRFGCCVFRSRPTSGHNSRHGLTMSSRQPLTCIRFSTISSVWWNHFLARAARSASARFRISRALVVFIVCSWTIVSVCDVNKFWIPRELLSTYAYGDMFVHRSRGSHDELIN